MKILNLLEGNNTELFHITGRSALVGMIELGGISLSMLNHNPGEKEVVDSAGYSGSKLYYLSMSRMRRNSFAAANTSEFSLYGRLKLDFRKISRYGRVVPVSFSGKAGERGETEDRLISDHPMLPWGVVEYIEVYVPKHVTHHDRVVMATLSDLVELRVFTDFDKFQTGRGWLSLSAVPEVESKYPIDRYHRVDGVSVPEREFELLLKFIETGDLTDSEAEYMSTRLVDLQIYSLLISGRISRKQHARLLKALRAKGIGGDDFHLIDDRLNERIAGVSGSSDGIHFWNIPGFNWYFHLKSEIGHNVVSQLVDFRSDIRDGVPDEILLRLIPTDVKAVVGLKSCYVDFEMNCEPDEKNEFKFRDGHLSGTVRMSHTEISEIVVRDVLVAIADMCSVMVKSIR